MANTNDMRYVRTEKALRAAFLELVSEQPVSSVTVSSICRKAGISRNAFYLHHASVAQLYAALVGEFVSDVGAESMASARRCLSTGTNDAFYEAILSSLARHEDLIRVLLLSDDGSLAKRLAQGMEDAFIEAALQFGGHGASLEHKLRCSYAAWALVGFLECWIAETDRPLEKSLDSFEELLESAVESSAHYLLNGTTS